MFKREMTVIKKKTYVFADAPHELGPNYIYIVIVRNCPHIFILILVIWVGSRFWNNCQLLFWVGL